MAFLPTGYTTTPIPKKSVKKAKKPKTIYSGGVDAAKSAGTSAAKGTIGSFTSKNTTTNARAGMNYRPITTRKGIVHLYENGERVLVKKKKNANPSRSLKTPNLPPDGGRITEDDPRWDARTMGDRTGVAKDGNYYKNGKRVPRYSGRKGRPSR